VLSIWLPVVLWTTVIAMESFFGSAGNTGPLLEGALTWLFGQADPVIFDRLHFVLRKGGHFLGYGILGYLWLRAFSATFLAHFCLYPWPWLRSTRRSGLAATVKGRSLNCERLFYLIS
jgi:hypothetical protein